MRPSTPRSTTRRRGCASSRAAPRTRSTRCAASGRRRSPATSPPSTRRRSPRSCRCGPASRSRASPRRNRSGCSQMEDHLHKRVIGQQEAIATISRAVRRARAGLKDPKRPIGSFIFLGPDGRRQDRARQGPRGVHVRQRGRAHQDRHERVHGAPQREPPGRRPSGLRRLRRGRPAHRGRAPQELRGRAARRDREGAPGGLQHPPPDPRGRAPHGREGPPGRLPQHDHHHDLQPRRAAAADELVARLPTASARRRTRAPQASYELHAREGPGRAEDRLPARVPQPHRRDDRVPLAHPGRDPRDRRPDARPACATSSGPSRCRSRSRRPPRTTSSRSGTTSPTAPGRSAASSRT